jgi:membrane protein
MNKVSLAAAAAVGYVLGASAGRARHDQIVRTSGGVRHSAPAQKEAGPARYAARDTATESPEGSARHTGPAGEADTTAADSPTKLTGASWRYAARRTLSEFNDDHCTDLAAALTYYAVLSLFPAAIALISVLGLVGQGRATVDSVLRVVSNLGGSSSLTDTLRPVLTSMSENRGAGLGFGIGIAAALWTASGYVNGFGRAMNRIYEVREGRPVWQLRPLMLLVTLATVLLAAVAALILVLSGGVARAVGSAVGLGSTAVAAWGVAKWPVLLIVVVLIVALLYYATPNVRQPRVRWISIGSTVAILVWVLASAGFGFYVANFGSYDKTYGSLAGVIVFLLWLWITNLALLLGAEIDAELERARELQEGLPAEDSIQLPVRKAKEDWTAPAENRPSG